MWSDSSVMSNMDVNFAAQSVEPKIQNTDKSPLVEDFDKEGLKLTDERPPIVKAYQRRGKMGITIVDMPGTVCLPLFWDMSCMRILGTRYFCTFQEEVRYLTKWYQIMFILGEHEQWCKSR